MEITDNITQGAFGKAKALVATYGALNLALLVVVVVLAVTGHEVSSFMWGRTVGVLISAAVTYRLSVMAAQGHRSAHRRVRIMSIVMPIVIIALDCIPGALPLWFTAIQITSGLSLASINLVPGRAVR